ncbi:hypothetical protein KQ945_07635 [Bacillus subtilis subsp. subtilis]|nr:hypothetical protein [Bacillus subtilis subsp. subtilis]
MSLRALAAATALLPLLAGCDATAPAAERAKPRRVLDTTANVEEVLYLSGTHEERLLAFLRKRYGDNAGLVEPWTDTWDDTEVEAQRPVTRSVCARDTVNTDGHRQHLLAVCQRIDDAASVEPGRVDLYVLRDGTDGQPGEDHDLLASLVGVQTPLVVVAQRLQGQYGRRGAPGAVQVEPLGPQRHAFRITHGEISRGVAMTSRTYVAVHNNRLREVALLREHIDNAAARHCGQTGKACDDPAFDVDFTVAVGTANAVDGYWPLTVRSHGQDCTGPAHSDDLVAFEPATRRYAVPAELQRTRCAE